jgi:hypothetical protein
MAPPPESSEEYVNKREKFIKEGKNVVTVANSFEFNDINTPSSKMFPPNTFVVSLYMHSSLDDKFTNSLQRFIPEWIYTPFVPKKLFTPSLNIRKVNTADIGTVARLAYSASKSFNSKLYEGTTKNKILLGNIDKYFSEKGSSKVFTDWFVHKLPELIRYNQRNDKKLKSKVDPHNIEDFYSKQSMSLNNSYNPLNVPNVQTVTKTSPTELINKRYSLYTTDLHNGVFYDFDEWGIQIVNLHTGETHRNVGTIEGLTQIATRYDFDANPIIEKIRSNTNANTYIEKREIPVELFQIKPREPCCTYKGHFSFFPVIEMSNIVSILSHMGAEQVFMVDHSCSVLTDLSHVKTIKDRNALGRKKTKKRKTLKHKR